MSKAKIDAVTRSQAGFLGLRLDNRFAYGNLEAIKNSLAENGWVSLVADADAQAIADEIGRLGELLGTRSAGRDGAMIEVIRPQAASEAHPRSLSNQFGVGRLPFHTELSHRLRPCRYLLLGCIDPGAPGADTLLLDWWTLSFSPIELELLKQAPVLVRAGRCSFYSTILSPSRAFLRYDPGCLEAVDSRGQAALALMAERLTGACSKVHRWRSGDILVVDNWRILHGRSPTDRASDRRLARILIDV